MQKKVDLLLIVGTLSLYFINQSLKTDISNEAFRWFMCCYFNDIIGSITFVSYTNIILSYRKQRLDALWKIELLLLGCGFFWEVITPLFRDNTVADIGDIIAYLFGGFLYYNLESRINKAKPI